MIQSEGLIIKQKFISVLKSNKKSTFVGSFSQIKVKRKTPEIYILRKKIIWNWSLKKLDFLHVTSMVVANQTLLQCMVH